MLEASPRRGPQAQARQELLLVFLLVLADLLGAGVRVAAVVGHHALLQDVQHVVAQFHGVGGNAASGLALLGFLLLEGAHQRTQDDLVLDLGFVAEFMEAVKILYDNPYYGVISEIALVAGVDQTVPLLQPGGGSAGSYSEVLGATVTSFVSDNFPVAFANKGFDFNLDMGASEPLFVLDNG